MLSVIVLTANQLYNVAFEEEKARLVETVKSQAKLMEAIARFDRQYSQDDVPGGAELLVQAGLRLRSLARKEDTVSRLGISTYPEHGDNMEELLRLADQAMYQAKKSGKNQYIVSS